MTTTHAGGVSEPLLTSMEGEAQVQEERARGARARRGPLVPLLHNRVSVGYTLLNSFCIITLEDTAQDYIDLSIYRNGFSLPQVLLGFSECCKVYTWQWQC